MKRVKIKSSLLVGIITLLALFPNFRSGSLKDVAKPHLGIYECTQAKLDGQDYLERFTSIILELKTEDEFVLHYAEKGGAKKQETGKYVYDREAQKIKLMGGAGNFFKHEFPLKEGVLTIELQIGTQALTMRFKHK